MRTLVVGCNHRSAPVEKRERIAFDDSAAARALQQLRQAYPEAEAVLLSTCNRTELYVARPVQGSPRIDEIIRFICAFHSVDVADFATVFYSFEDLEAVRHLFRVASALDSMVLGESQIIGQTRSAFELARGAGAVGPALDTLFQQALSTARLIHTTTGIAVGTLSVGSTAVELARQVFSHFDDKSVLMVGAGEMGELTLTHLLATKPKQLWVTNRTDERAAALARRVGEQCGVAAQAVPFAEWIEYLAIADIVITSTGAREPILTAERFAPIPRRRDERPLLLIDIAVPRDVDPAVGRHECVFLYNIDDLQSVTEANLAQRKLAVTRANEIVESAVVDFVERQGPCDVGPVIDALRRHFEQVGQRELERILPKLGNVSARDRELIEELLHRVTQKLLHDPVQRLGRPPANGPARLYADALRALFGLQE